MIDKQQLTSFIEQQLAGTNNFLVEVRVTPDNVIAVEIDRAEGVDIDTCVALSRKIEEQFDRDADDYELEVGSAGLTSPFKVRGQYVKNLGNRVEVLTKDGKKVRGELSHVGDNDSDVEFTIMIEKKVKEPGKKKPVMIQEPLELKASECKSVKYSFD
ncbi:MAG: ribosome assembly cofactor RimP [Muribaculum sp.]|nr:ribosome assembly cofactor RimP [Muribaculaceae bacterium]MCM1081525.1 ribosome assembly cofactor RimP [Muribaculum sp.]